VWVGRWRPFIGLASQSVKAVPSALPLVCLLPYEVEVNSDLKVKWARTRSWCDLIVKGAEESALDPLLVAAVIWQESGGDPLAYSSSGAVGLMQIMPKDGIAAEKICVNGPCFSDRPTTQELQNPEFNIRYGCRMLADLITRLGSKREALMAYGPENIGYEYANTVLGLYAILSQ